MDFDRFLDQAWTDHAEQPAAVAERLAEPGLALLQQEDQVPPLAALALHVHGQHLARCCVEVQPRRNQRQHREGQRQSQQQQTNGGIDAGQHK